MMIEKKIIIRLFTKSYNVDSTYLSLNAISVKIKAVKLINLVLSKGTTCIQDKVDSRVIIVHSDNC